MNVTREFKRWQANFGTGLAVVLPVVISIAIVIWLFGSVANITDKLLYPLKFFLDKTFIYENGRDGKIFWYWSITALFLAIFLVGLLGGLARYYLGKQLIRFMDHVMMRVPLINKVYGAIKQVNDAFTTNNRSTFKEVVMVEWPSPGIWSIGFITGDTHPELQAKTGEKIISLFVPTTPNPTTGFLVLVSEEKVTRLRMSVAEGVKYIMSLGSVAPRYTTLTSGGIPAPAPIPNAAASPPPSSGQDMKATGS